MPKNMVGPRDPAGHGFVRSRWVDKTGRTIAVRWRSRVVGEMWLALDRQSAVDAGVIPDNRDAGLPVYYLDEDDLKFIEGLGETGMNQIHEFKKRFLSPAIDAPETQRGAAPAFGA